jgi:hypothetical protein
MFTDAEDGHGGAVRFTNSLADEVLKDETNFSELGKAHARGLQQII